MTETTQVAEYSELFSIVDFVVEAVNATDGEPRETFDTLQQRLGHPDFAIWLQRKATQNVAFASSVILEDIRGLRTCWLWLVYAKPGAETRIAVEDYIMPWAASRGAGCLQAGNSDYSPAKARWFRQLRMRKQFEVYERSILWEKKSLAVQAVAAV